MNYLPKYIFPLFVSASTWISWPCINQIVYHLIWTSVHFYNIHTGERREILLKLKISAKNWKSISYAFFFFGLLFKASLAFWKNKQVKSSWLFWLIAHLDFKATTFLYKVTDTCSQHGLSFQAVPYCPTKRYWPWKRVHHILTEVLTRLPVLLTAWHLLLPLFAKREKIGV